MSRSRRIIGILLLVAGVALLLSMLGYLPGAAFLLILGGGFCGVYAAVGGRRSYGNVGFLIPGLVLLAVGSFAVLEETLTANSPNPGYFFALLATAFLGVALVHTRAFRQADHGERNWPLYPAAGLTLLGVLLALEESIGVSLAFLQMLNYLWIAALIGVGLWLVVSPWGIGSE
ncbi:MAG: hypothetical protein R6U92_07445 [Bacillota bacterium]